MAKTAVVWGHKLHSHTHSYVHEGFARAFKFLGYDVHWVDDEDDVSGVDFSGALFVTEGQVDTRIPIRRDCKYVLHNCDGRRYESVRSNCLTIQVYCAKQMQSRSFDRVGPASYYADGVLYQPWATDLLPHEIRLEWADLPRNPPRTGLVLSAKASSAMSSRSTGSAGRARNGAWHLCREAACRATSTSV